MARIQTEGPRTPRDLQAEPRRPAERAALAPAAPLTAPAQIASARGDARTHAELREEAALTGAGQRPAAAHGARSSAMLALRVAAGRTERLDASAAKHTAGSVVLEAKLVDPATGRAPTLDQVASDIQALLRRGLGAAGREVLGRVANEPREAYYVLTYDQGTGALALKRVATGDERHVQVGVDQLRAALRDGETLLGGIHNHPNRVVARASNADRQANAALQHLGGNDGYQDFVLARGKKSGPSLAAVRPSAVEQRSAAFQGALVEYQAFFKKSAKHDGGVRGGFISDGPSDVRGEELLQGAIDQGGDSKRKLAVDGDRFVVFDETNGMTGEFHGHYRDWDELNQKQQNALMKAGLVDRKGRPR